MMSAITRACSMRDGVSASSPSSRNALFVAKRLRKASSERMGCTTGDTSKPLSAVLLQVNAHRDVRT